MCPVCFFRENHQKQLKLSCFGISRFEDKLRAYKQKFIEGVQQLDSLNNCACYETYSHEEMIKWTNSFLTALKDSRGEIGDSFDSLISVYEAFIGKNLKISIDRLWMYTTEKRLLNHTETLFNYRKILFRGRAKSNFDETDIKQYFHIPFSKRHYVGNQRFSVSGQPMLYFGSSILAVEKELDCAVEKLATAAFIPIPSDYRELKIFSLKNDISEIIENSLPGIFSAGGNISYNEGNFTPSKETILSDIHRSVLMNLCTFPVENREAFVAEYAIPQMLTTALLENDYAGRVFPSTKDYSELNGAHKFSSHQLNFGVFVPYDKENDINENLLSRFSVFTLDNSENLTYTVDEIISKYEEITSVTRASLHNNNDHLLPICNLNLYLEYMKEAKIFGEKYFETCAGKLELAFYMKILSKIQGLVR